MSDEIKAAFISGIFSLAIGILGTLGVQALLDPGDEELQRIEATTIRDMSDAFIEFISAYHALHVHMQQAIDFTGSADSREKFQTEAKGLFVKWQTATNQLSSLLRFAQVTYNEQTRIQISAFITWHEKSEKARVNQAATAWQPVAKYQEWRYKILQEAVKAVKA